FSHSRRMGWALCGFFFGWVGLVLLLALHEWPARVACPKCRGLRVVTRATCEHCGALHALPEPDGTEVFAENGTGLQPFRAPRTSRGFFHLLPQDHTSH